MIPAMLYPAFVLRACDLHLSALTPIPNLHISQFALSHFWYNGLWLAAFCYASSLFLKKI
jgi:hypothetical protein